GADAVVSWVAPMLARELCALHRRDDAEPLVKLGRRYADENDPGTQAIWRQAWALMDAAAGRHEEAERLSREAVGMADRTDALNMQGDALGDLAHVLAAAGRTDEANAVLGQALDRYERKHNHAMAAHIRARLAVAPTTSPVDSEHASASAHMRAGSGKGSYSP